MKFRHALRANNQAEKREVFEARAGHSSPTWPKRSTSRRALERSARYETGGGSMTALGGTPEMVAAHGQSRVAPFRIAS